MKEKQSCGLPKAGPCISMQPVLGMQRDQILNYTKTSLELQYADSMDLVVEA